MTETEQEATEAAGADTPPSADDNKWKRLLLGRKLLLLPYLLGLVWTCLHPVLSILTGEAKCRGWYIDEHSILVRYPNMGSKQAPSHLHLNNLPGMYTNLCDGLENATNVGCYTHHQQFQVASIVPLANALEPMEETIVFVVNAPLSSATASLFHRSLVASMQTLADPIQTPWLAKTFLLISSLQHANNNESSSLEDTVTNFLDAYYGTSTKDNHHYSTSTTATPPLPPKLCQGMLRSLVVIDVQHQVVPATTPNEPQVQIRALPHGRRGVLPNADLVFLIGRLWSQSTLLGQPHQTRKQQQQQPPLFVTHGYPQESLGLRQWIDSNVNKNNNQKWADYIQELGDLALFAKTAAVGPFPPHAPALDRGIDSITIQAKFQGKISFSRDPGVEMVQYMEYLLHSLSNLHERLHHSFTLYWLPSPYKFVSHIESLLPIILLLLPCVIRALGIVLVEMKEPLHLQTMGVSILVTLIGALSTSVAVSFFNNSNVLMNTWWALLHTMVAYCGSHYYKTCLQHNEQQQAPERILQTLQFVACVLTVYILVPIAFAHGALAYLPAMVWTPIMAYPKYWSFQPNRRLLLGVLLLGLPLIILTSPSVVLVPKIFAGQYTAFVQFAHVPLHLQFLFLLCMLVLIV